MARKPKLRPTPPLVWVFWEGESEQVYSRFLKEKFEEVAIIKTNPSKGLFVTAKGALRGSASPLKRDINNIDEVWFFFDIDRDQPYQWAEVSAICKKINRSRETGIKVRLLMTTGCMEYWLLLHFERCTPSIVTVADKEKIELKIKEKEPTYKKGDWATTRKVAARYPEAVSNAEWVLRQLDAHGLPALEDSDTRNQWLLTCRSSFSTVFEAVQYLTDLVKQKAQIGRS